MQSIRLLSTTRRCLSIWKINHLLRRSLTIKTIHTIHSNPNNLSCLNRRLLLINRNDATMIPIRYASSGNLPSHKKITLPALSPTMETGTLRSWSKQEGDQIAEGDILAEIETDKATLGFESGDEGFIAKILVPSGSKDVPVGKLCAIIVEKKEDIAAFKDYKDDGSGTISTKKKTSDEQPAPTTKPEKKEKEASPPPPAPKKEETTSKTTSTPTKGDRVFASPLARKLAGEKGIDLSSVQGSGPNGRVVADDIEKFIKEGGAKAKVDQITTTKSVKKEKETPVRTGGYDEQQVSAFKTENARRIAESKSTIPHYYLNIEVELDEILKLRQKLNELTASKSKDKSRGITINDFVIKAAALACKKRPETNSIWMEKSIRQYETVDINIAIHTDAGILFTPILYNVDQKGLSTINKELLQLNEKANGGKFHDNELEMGTFTISNLGMYGVTNFSAVIYPQQSAILAVGGIETKIVPASDSPKGYRQSSVLHVTLACDHRVIDGAIGAQWLQEFKQYLEQPGSMIL
jgi:pyruvate dehydrogenase E2 component (dihydrolipoamide acetyltransferase)